jgi:hypothetical protein
MVEFIKITHSLNEALAYNASGQEDSDTYYFGGVQLLPNNPYPYIQRTHNKSGIEIEDWQVWVCDTCGNEIEEITDYFNVDRVFQDTDGKPQIEWSLKDVPFDFGYRLVLLKILQGVNDYHYTSPFYFTAYNAIQTSRWDYRNADNETMLSCQLQAFYRQPMSEMNVVSRNRIDTGRRVMDNIQNPEFELWKTQEIDKEFFRKFKNIFLSRQLYVDFQKTTLWEGIDTPEIEFDQNFLETNFSISRNENQTYDPNYTAPPIPPPPPVLSQIVLYNALSVDNNNVALGFYFVNFDPGYVILEYSEDGVTWIGAVNKPPFEPQTIYAPNNTTEAYYYRVRNGSIVSDSIQLLPPELEITNITGQPGYFQQTGNIYFITYNVVGYTPSIYLSFEGSVNGSVWQPLYYNTNNDNPKQVQTPSSGQEFKYFRVKDNNKGIISNVYFHEF